MELMAYGLMEVDAYYNCLFAIYLWDPLQILYFMSESSHTYMHKRHYKDVSNQIILYSFIF